MGCSISREERDARKKSSQIEKYLADDKRKHASVYEIKMLLLGAGESGKSTIAKQMKIIHMNGYSHAELLEFRIAIYKNVFECSKNLIEAIEKLTISYEDPLCLEYADFVKSKVSVLNIENHLITEVCRKMQKIWSDKASQLVMQKTNEFYIMDSAAYFLDSLERISSVHYVPSEEDVLRSRIKSTGITEFKFSIDRLNIVMFDVGGQRSERKKWIHCFEAVTSIIFVVALSEYDQPLLEDSSQNRMAESLLLFKSIVNSKWFIKSSVVLFLNKIDLFKEKLNRVPLSNHFPEYAGDNDFTKASKFILWRFKQLNRANLALYPHLTCATDTKQIRVVFNAVKDTLIKNSLKDSGLM